MEIALHCRHASKSCAGSSDCLQKLHANPADLHANPADLHANPADLHANPADLHANPADLHANPADLHRKLTGCNSQSLLVWLRNAHD